ncbi:MAG: roadblock/LC7 domain-containing protein [Acidobacteriota bacterium]
MFVERLEDIAQRIEGAQALSLVAKDGIPVESVSRDETIDLEILAAELMSQVRAVAQNHEDLSVGRVRHFAVTTDRLTLMVSRLTSDYYLLLVTLADSNAGKARYELRRAALQFEGDL